MQHKKKIVIIDDEETHLYTAKGLLESDRFEVITYKGSFGATNCIKASEPDLVLVDVNMPALSGENLVSLIKPYCMEMKTPILFYSSNDEAKLKELVAIHDVQGYICKGDIAALYSQVNAMFQDPDRVRNWAKVGRFCSGQKSRSGDDSHAGRSL